MERGLRKVFIDQHDLVDRQYETIYNDGKSVKRQETDVVTAGLGTFLPKVEGTSPAFDNAQEAWTKVYTHVTWALGLELTEEAREDNLYGFYEGLSGQLGQSAAYTREVQAMDLFNNLSNTVYVADSTAFTLLSTSHFRVDGGTWSNTFEDPADLSLESLELALTQWRGGMVDQRGRLLTVQPEILMVGRSDEWVADRLLMTEKLPESNRNDRNSVRARRNLRLFVADFMTDDGRWFLLAPKSRTALVYFPRVATQMRRRDDPVTGNMLMVGRYRESHGASHATGIWGTT
jgi:phage major head subunit gpT-like protein